MKRRVQVFLPLLLLIVFVFPLRAKADSESGQCGDNVYYKISDDGSVMTIYGTGDMYKVYSSHNLYHGGIEISSYPSSIIIEEGVTSISEQAFTYGSFGNSWAEHYKNVSYVSLPSSLQTIGYGAFWGCHALTSITIPSGVKTVHDYFGGDYAPTHSFPRNTTLIFTQDADQLDYSIIRGLIQKFSLTLVQ